MSLCRASASCNIRGKLFMLFDVAVPNSGLRISICCDTIIMRLLNIDTSRSGSCQRLCQRIPSSCHFFARWDKVEAIHDHLQEPLISYDLRTEKDFTSRQTSGSTYQKRSQNMAKRFARLQRVVDEYMSAKNKTSRSND